MFDVYICRIYSQYLVIVYIIQLEYGYRSRFGVGRIDASWTDIAQAEEPRIIMWESEKEPASESQLHGFLLSRLSLSSVGPLSSKIIRAQVAMQMQKQQEEQAMSEAFAAFAQCERRTMNKDTGKTGFPLKARLPGKFDLITAEKSLLGEEVRAADCDGASSVRISRSFDCVRSHSTRSQCLIYFIWFDLIWLWGRYQTMLLCSFGCSPGKIQFMPLFTGCGWLVRPRSAAKIANPSFPVPHCLHGCSSLAWTIQMKSPRCYVRLLLLQGKVKEHKRAKLMFFFCSLPMFCRILASLLEICSVSHRCTKLPALLDSR